MKHHRCCSINLSKALPRALSRPPVPRPSRRSKGPDQSPFAAIVYTRRRVNRLVSPPLLTSWLPVRGHPSPFRELLTSTLF